MKCRHILLAAIVLLAVVAFAQNPPKVHLATLAPSGSTYTNTLRAMGEKWAGAPHGGVHLILHADGAGMSGGEAQMVKAMRTGGLDAAMLTTPGLATIEPSIGALQGIPLMFRSLAELEYVRGKMRGEFERRFREKGFVILFLGDSGWVHIFSRQPALHPEEFKRLKMFAWAGDKKQIQIMEQEGYHPVPLEFTGTLTALQTNMIDAVPTLPVYANLGQFCGPLKHMFAIPWVPLSGALVISQRVWDRLPADTRAALQAAADEAGRKIQDDSRKAQDAAVAEMRKRGLQVHPMTPDLEKEWVATVERLYPRISGNLVPADSFNQVSKFVQEYRATAAKPGMKAPRPR